MEKGGTIEHAQAIVARESPCTTKLIPPDTSDAISLAEIERIELANLYFTEMLRHSCCCATTVIKGGGTAPFIALLSIVVIG